MAHAVLRERLVDAIRDPQERELAQRRQVALTEVVAERRVDSLGRVDVAVGHAAPQGFGGRVDELDLVGGANPGVGHRLALCDAGDALDDVVQALEVLDVHRRDDIDARFEQLLDVLPALRVSTARGIGVRELVDERHRGMASEHSVEVHLVESRAAVLDLPPRDDLEVAELLDRLRAGVGLDETDHDVGAPLGPAAALVEHVEGLAHARRGTEVDAQRASGHGWDSSPRFPRQRDRARGSARARSRRARRGTPATARRCGRR